MLKKQQTLWLKKGSVSPLVACISLTALASTYPDLSYSQGYNYQQSPYVQRRAGANPYSASPNTPGYVAPSRTPSLPPIQPLYNAPTYTPSGESFTNTQPAQNEYVFEGGIGPSVPATQPSTPQYSYRPTYQDVEPGPAPTPPVISQERIEQVRAQARAVAEERRIPLEQPPESFQRPVTFQPQNGPEMVDALLNSTPTLDGDTPKATMSVVDAPKEYSMEGTDVPSVAEEMRLGQAEPVSKLDDQTQTILSKLPRLIQPHNQRGPSGPVAIDRVTPDVTSLTELGDAEEEVARTDSLGMSIAVRKQPYSVNSELQRAYNAILAGDTALATLIYQDVLKNAPRNQDALFGLATLYQRLGNIPQAKEFYGTLLRINHHHKEGVNNFLALVAEESPEEALPYLGKLLASNPEFAPGYAQIAMVYQRIGRYEDARNAIARAVLLEPENLVYRYNYAVILDEQEDYRGAQQLYVSLIRASLQGQKIPANVDDIQERLTFIASNKANKT